MPSPQQQSLALPVHIQVDWRRIGKAARRAAILAAAVPLTAGAAVMVTDKIRGQRYPLDSKFPTAAPMSTEIDGTTATLYTYGDDLYEAMLEAIDGARHTVFLETYIWKGDDTGERFKRAISEAAARGVEVYVVYDGFANLVVPQSFFHFPPQVHVLRFPALRPGLLTLDVRRSGRDHRKILVVDDEVAFVGGYNIGEEYATKWRDTHIRLEGRAAWELQNAFVDFWNRWRTHKHPVLQDKGAEHWQPSLRAARNAPSDLVFPIRGLYLDAIDRATSHIYITQAYFIPDRDILKALLAAAARGVDVRVLVPERSNHSLADWLARGRYTKLLRGGVRIMLYEGAMVHAKTATIDGRWSTVGTANIDRLSLTGNYEINLEIVDAGVASTLEEVFRMDESNSHELTYDEWRERSLLTKVAERVLEPLEPLL
ncbi:cardiolipin synthase [Isoptericola sp. CG 20/1183]|uniref:Cardiolipin synthase n=1 Tax=Isoptericola halotolerans TaxID=300560 RepID=A0ABX5ECA2_9MICO|nr:MULTISPECIES: phospholipase D-like domain-containing protein [Isoptericola]MCK0115466.1 phospholipase D-like domain-containing protein [Isoptericola sp. S6320L]PRZ04458.1 cardiolipin synthase [Isoptericola halotolerans]PRZ04644.1 cardiolipin synthase [Isoptericola sp. CG 20/1183]